MTRGRSPSRLSASAVTAYVARLVVKPGAASGRRREPEQAPWPYWPR